MISWIKEELILMVSVIVNFTLFFIHKSFYRNPQNRIRRIWGIIIIIIGIGLAIFLAFLWQYRTYQNMFTVWLVIIIISCGLIMLVINKDIQMKRKSGLGIDKFLLPIFAFFVIYTIGWTFHHEIDHIISLGMYWLICAIIYASMFFIIQSIRKKSWENAIIPALLGSCICSALPYMPTPWQGFMGLYFNTNTFAIVLFYLINLLPELFGIIGLLLIKRNKIIAICSIVIAVLLAFEIMPVRMVFRYDETASASWYRSKRKKFKSYGNLDKEYEFKRSLQIIENLDQASTLTAKNKLTTVIICVPDTMKNPSILKLDTVDPSEQYRNWQEFWSNFKEETLLIDVSLDSDGDGLSDFREAELLSDAYNQDTDADGISDGKDSDPVNPLIESDLAVIKSKILGEINIDTTASSFYLVTNFFQNGEGTFANFDRHVILLHFDQVGKWNVIFGEQYMTDYGQRSHYSQYITFGGYVFDVFHKVVSIGFIQHHGIWSDSGGWQLILIKWQGEWKVIGVRFLWT